MTLERTYNIPLRKEWLRAPKYRRAKRAVHAVQNFLMKHMKATEVKVGQHLNMLIWSKGIKNPPHHVEVKAIKDDKGVCFAELVNAPAAQVEEVKKAPEAKAEAPKAAPVKEEPKTATPKPTPKEAKPVPKKTESEKKEAKQKAAKK